ncbi:hypothetical protein MNBD_GAMMA15-1331 [hydrothermal vent metagenome]|uniref:Uncharacterized protein n=1 Tax=hydrothermal vent metagenome TaxID=652676 RepID=A0A3B0ZDT3_9ZZZZ
MSSLEIFCCRDIKSSQWQLVPLPKDAGSLILIGWKERPDDMDGNISERLASILGSTLTAIARVSFPQSTIKTKYNQNDGWETDNNDLIRNLGKGGLTERAGALVKNLPSEIHLVSTEIPESVAPLFNDPVYPWWLQGQVALLSRPGNTAPEIDRKTVLALLNGNWGTEISNLVSIGVQGLFMPGVDGAVAGLYVFSRDFEKLFFSEIKRQCKQLNMRWEEFGEDEFSEHLSG